MDVPFLVGASGQCPFNYQVPYGMSSLWDDEEMIKRSRHACVLKHVNVYGGSLRGFFVGVFTSHLLKHREWTTNISELTDRRAFTLLFQAVRVPLCKSTSCSLLGCPATTFLDFS